MSGDDLTFLTACHVVMMMFWLSWVIASASENPFDVCRDPGFPCHSTRENDGHDGATAGASYARDPLNMPGWSKLEAGVDLDDKDGFLCATLVQCPK